MTLTSSAKKSVSWTGISLGVGQGLQLIVTAILARILSPDDFGVLGMAIVFTGFLQIFNDFGIGKALIQRKELEPILVTSCFWANLLIGVMLMALTIVGSPMAALYYQNEKVAPLLALMSVNFPIIALTIVHKSLLERDMNFKKTSIGEIAASVGSSMVAVYMAVTGCGVWSLVGRQVASSIIQTVYLIGQVGGIIKFQFSLRKLKDILAFSGNLLGFNVINYFARNADYLLIGRFLGATALGYYTIAYRLMLYPLNIITGLLSRILFPVFAVLQDDYSRFRGVYLKSTWLTAFITFPMMMGLFAVAPEFILGVLGEKWRPAILLIRILCWVGLVQSLISLTGNIYLSTGKTRQFMYWGLFASSIAVTGIVIGLHWGIVGVALGYAIASLLLIYPAFAVSFRFISLRVIELPKVIWRIFFSSIIMMLIVFIFKHFLVSPIAWSMAFKLFIEVLLGIVTYILLSWILNRDQVNEMIGLVLSKKAN